jgi:N-acetylneuraminic acid mutarotase
LILVQGSTELRRRTSAGDEVTASHRNDGTIRVIGGETSFEIVLGGASSTFTNAHTVELIQGGTLSVTNVATPASAVINTPTGVLMGSGTVRFRPGGSYPDPTGVNNGTIAPGVAGVPGALQWEGSLHMGETGVIDIELRGRIPGVEHGQINVTRDLVLGSGMPAGRLIVTSPGFSLPMGTRYPVLTFRSRVGAFADIDLIAGSTLDTVWVSGQGADTLYLEVIDGPPPTSDVWTWMGGSPERDRPGQWGSPGVPSVTNIPSARPFAAVWALPSQQTTDVWLFGGFGRDVQGLNGALGDLWHFDGAAWTWVGGPNLANAPPVHGERGIANESNHPGGRFGAATWVDASGNLWLFGGRTNQGAVFSSGTLRNDLWRYDRQTRSWTWVSGSSSTNASGVYGSQGVPDPANVPGARAYAVSWIDSTGNLWLFGGRDPSGAVYNDLWRFDVGSGTWTWIKGSASVNRPGEYGARGVPDAANTPGARSNALAWVDRFGDFWLFGGLSGQSDYFNDLWRFDGTDWTWVSGADTTNEPGAYGARGVASAANVPGARSSRAAWVDASGDVWLFGGFGYAAQGSAGYLNDLWRFDGSSWAWISGAQTTNEAGSYSETPGERGVNYRPGARSAVAAWTGPAGSFWLFGGSGYDGSGLLGPLNDVWRYEP